MDYQEILDKFLMLEYSKRVNENQVAIRCPICGDSMKHLNAAHCYIGLINNIGPLVYHCWISGCSGIVNNEFLKLCGIYDSDMSISIHYLNKNKIMADNKFAIQKLTQYIEITDEYGNEDKYNYLYNRLGINFSVNELRDLKVIFDLRKFLSDNEIRLNNKYKNIASILDKQYIGFLSNSKQYIIFRNIKKDDYPRYFNYPIFNIIENSSKFYTVSSNADLLANDIDLIMAEGCFDIISIFYNIYGCDNMDKIYTAVAGNGYMNVIKHIIRMGFLGNLNIHIYSDKDKNKEFYYNIYKELNILIKNISIYYNSEKGEKDFGVRPEKIKVVKVKI